VQLYIPSAAVGARLPHAWLRAGAGAGAGGARLSTLDLVSLAGACPRSRAPRFTLLVAGGAPETSEWLQFLAEDLRHPARRLAPDPGGLFDGGALPAAGDAAGAAVAAAAVAAVAVAVAGVVPAGAAGGAGVWEEETGGEAGRARWAGVCGLDRGGAVLVRPDGHVAFRARAGLAALRADAAALQCLRAALQLGGAAAP